MPARKSAATTTTPGITAKNRATTNVEKSVHSGLGVRYPARVKVRPVTDDLIAGLLLREDASGHFLYPKCEIVPRARS